MSAHGPPEKQAPSSFGPFGRFGTKQLAGGGCLVSLSPRSYNRLAAVVLTRIKSKRARRAPFGTSSALFPSGRVSNYFDSVTRPITTAIPFCALLLLTYISLRPMTAPLLALSTK